MSRDPAALIEAIETRSDRPFAWRRGRDCVSFAAACVRAQTGIDPLAGLPRWRSLRAAKAAIEAEGGLEQALDARLPRIAPALARRGDIAGVPDELFGIRLLVVEGETLVGPGERGLERLPRGRMTMAWRVGGEGVDE